jgi:hypothetical protein
MSSNDKTSRLSLIESNTMAEPDRKFWNFTAPSSPKELNVLYSLGLFDLVTQKAFSIPKADPARRGSPWFQFPIPPQAYSLTETGATVVVPTQWGGKFVESQGCIFRDIRLSGTVGIRPNPVGSNLLPAGLTQATGLTLSMPKTLSMFTNDDRGLDPDEITGFDDIIFLRNIFRSYWDLKKSNEMARRIVMVWIYAKDSDIFIVEPMGLTVNKDKSNPMSYTYEITLRTLYRFDKLIVMESDPVSLWQGISNLASFISNAVNDIVTAINQIANIIEYVATLPLRIANAVVGLATQVVSAFANLKNIGSRLSSANERGLRNLKNNVETMRSLCASKENAKSLGIGSRVFTSKPPTSPDGIPLVTTAAAALAMHKNQAVRAAVTLQRVAERALSIDAFFTTTKQTIVEDYKKVYNKTYDQFNGGSPLNMNNIKMPSSAVEQTIMGNETVRGLAKRFMGDESYWKMIVIANKLKPPYLSTTRGDGVLAYGDKILIPKRPDDQDFTNIQQETNTDQQTETLSPMMKKYGRDIRLSGGSLGTDYADLQVSSRGDLDVIDGVDNVNQALMVKMSTEQGELATHPTFGALYPIGSKVSLPQLQEFSLNARRTVLSDPRIASIEQMRTFADGDLVRMSMKLALRQSNIKLPVEFAVRSA